MWKLHVYLVIYFVNQQIKNILCSKFYFHHHLSMNKIHNDVITNGYAIYNILQAYKSKFMKYNF